MNFPPGIRIDHGIVMEAGYASYWQSIHIPSWAVAGWLLILAVFLLVWMVKDNK